MKAPKCLVVDDEPLAIDIVAGYLQKMDIHPVCCENGMEALEQLSRAHFDLLFLDIEMPGINGISLLKKLVHRPAVVITTAYRHYAVEGFELEALDYLVKPFAFSRLQQTMQRFSKSKNEEQIVLKVDKQLVKVLLSDILYIESLKDYIRVRTLTEEHVCHQTLTAFTARLAPGRFVRVHRSYTVALDKVRLFTDGTLHIGEKTIPVSRELRKEVRRRLQA